MRLSELTYARVAEQYEVGLCTGCDIGDHSSGFVAARMVHFRERGVTRSGLRRFLMLVHQSRVQPNSLSAQWPRNVRTALWLHGRNIFAYEHAFNDLGIRIPRRLSAADRAKVRFLLAGEGLRAPSERERLRELVKDLRKWAQMS